MYKATAEVESTQRDLITVEMNSRKDNVRVYVRNVCDCKDVRQAGINISPDGFIDLVYPILKAKGYQLMLMTEEF